MYEYEVKMSTYLACRSTVFDESELVMLESPANTNTKNLAAENEKAKGVSNDVNYPPDSEAELKASAQTLVNMLGGQCVLHIKGWWSYELCFKKYIRQFHNNKDNSVEEFSLGNYLSLEKDVISTELGKKIFVELYEDGTECDLTGEQRHTKVIYKCVSSVGYVEILSVEESVSCGYEVVVAMPGLCGLKGFSGVNTAVQKGLKLDKTICVPKATYEKMLNASK